MSSESPSVRSVRLSRADSSKRSDIELPEPDPPFWTKTSWLQLGYGVWVNLTLVNIGLCLEFSAVAIPQFKSEGSDIQVTKNQEAMIASTVTLSSPIGCILAGVILDKFGRRAGLIWCQVPIVIGWLYIACAKYASGIIFGRVVGGIGIGMAMGAPRAYVTEITLPNMRGVIGSLPNLAMSLGLTVQAILGTFLDWRLLCYLCGGFAGVLFVANYFLAETPYYILLNSSASNAKVTLMRFRSSKYNIEAELQTLEEFRTMNNIRSLSLWETKAAMMKSSACKPFAIIMTYMTLMQLSGVNVVTAWAVEMLEMAHSTIDPHLGNIVLGITRIVVGVATSFLLFRVGRRPLAVVSAVGVGGVGIILGGYLHTHEGGRSPLVMMVSFVAFAVPGYHTLPTMMMFELFPLQIRGILSGIVLSSANLLMFGAVQIYPTMRDSIGMANTYLTYGIISLIGAVVLHFILPETKELTLQEIEEYFNHRRATLISERRLLSFQIRSQILSGQDRSGSINKYKKKKTLKIVASDDGGVTFREDLNRERKFYAGTNRHKPAQFLSEDDIVVVYDEDEIDAAHDKKVIKKDKTDQKRTLDNDAKQYVNPYELDNNIDYNADDSKATEKKEKNNIAKRKKADNDNENKKKRKNTEKSSQNKSDSYDPDEPGPSKKDMGPGDGV